MTESDWTRRDLLALSSLGMGAQALALSAPAMAAGRGTAEQPGHTIWHADGLKLSRVEELPSAFLDRVRRLHPQQLDLDSV